MDLPDIGRYRRRFIVEFGPEDSGLVDRMGEVHKTKRAAIIAGLRLLDSGEVERLRERVAALEADLASAQADLARHTEAAKEAKPAAAAARADLREKRSELAEARAELRAIKTANAEGKKTVADLVAERDRLAALVPHYAYCGYCNKLVPEAEWAEMSAEKGVYVYHKSDGYRARGSAWSGAATILFWRAKAGLPTSEVASS